MSGELCNWTEEDNRQAQWDEEMRKSIALGYVRVVGKDINGRVLYQLTEAGQAYVKNTMDPGITVKVEI